MTTENPYRRAFPYDHHYPSERTPTRCECTYWAREASSSIEGHHPNCNLFQDDGPYPPALELLAKENKRFRETGCKLAEVALRVVREYDGTHRLMLAVAEWAQVVADEGGRGAPNER